MSGPLIVQSDRTILLEAAHPDAAEAAVAIAPFAQLARTPEHVHTYTITPLGLWNARASGHDAESVVDTLLEFAGHPVPHEVLLDIVDIMDRFGVLTLVTSPVHGLVLTSARPELLDDLVGQPELAGILGARIDAGTVAVHPSERGELKHRLLKLGHPVADHAGYVDGEAHSIALTADAPEPDPEAEAADDDGSGPGSPAHWHLRDYQQRAVDSFLTGESGVVVLPCGAGKTVVGAATMAAVGTTTLILVTNSVSAQQWKAELLRRTSLTAEEIGEYSGTVKEIRPVTIATYQVPVSYTHLTLPTKA